MLNVFDVHILNSVMDSYVELYAKNIPIWAYLGHDLAEVLLEIFSML